MLTDTLLVPFFPVFAAAANIGEGINAAALQPDQSSRVKIRNHRDSETTVAFKQSWIGSIALQAFLVDQVHRNSGLVLSRVKNLLHFECAQIERYLRRPVNFADARFQVE